MKYSMLVAALFLGGCVTQASLASPVAPARVNQVRESNYTIGVERTVVVGDPIVRVRDYSEVVTETATMEASESFRLSGGIVHIDFQRGERLQIVGQRVEEGVTFAVARKGEFGIQIAEDGSISSRVINGMGRGAMQVVMVYRFEPNSPTARFIRVADRRAQRTSSGQNFELVFNGIDGQAMRFQYREYTGDDLARPAFFQELSYPLATSTVRFREVIINVASIDAQAIRYTVVADGRSTP